MAIARKVAYNVAISSISKVFSTILALVAIGFVTRYLGTEGFGNYATALAFLSFFASVADLGLYHISTREISRRGADEAKIMGNIFALRILSSLAIILVAPLVVFFFDYPSEVKQGIIIAVASFLFSSSYQVLNGVFQKNLAMDKVAVAELAGKAVQVATIIAAVKLQLGFNWIVSALLLNMAVNFLIVFFWSKKYLRFGLRFDFTYWKAFLKESLPIGIGSVIVFFYFKVDTILLSLLKSGADVGIYNAAYKVLENITFFPSMVIGLILPILSHSISDDKARFRDTADKTFRFFLIMVVPIVIGALFLADGIIDLIGGGQFAQSADVLRILVFALASIFFGIFFNNILIAGGLQKKLLLVWSAAAVFSVLANLMLIPRFSYFAAAYNSFATESLVAALSFYFVFTEMKYAPSLKNLERVFLSGAAMAAFLFLAKELPFLIAAPASALAYAFFLWIFKAVETSEILSLISKKGIKEYEELP